MSEHNLILHLYTSFINSGVNIFIIRRIFATMIVFFFQTIHTTDDPMQEQRKRLIANYCSEPLTNRNLSNVYPRKLINFNNSIVYCRINKCASTFSLESLRKLFPCTSDSCEDVETVIKSRDRHEIQRQLKEKFSFFFVREPYRRLFSTYSNKFYLPKEHWAPVGPEIVKRYRIFPSKDSLLYGHDITFRELIQYAVDMYEAGKKLDVHLRPIHLLCNPCLFDFTYVGTLETLDTDWQNMFQYWKRFDLVNVPNNATAKDVYASSDLPEILHFFSTKEQLSDSDISLYNLFLRTWTYYKISGKIAKHTDMPYTRGNIKSVKYDKFHQEVSNAIEKSKELGIAVKAQKEEALLQAYSSIPRELLERLRKVVLQDCLMFGYDDRPEWLFNEHLRQYMTDFDYFPGI